LNRFSLNVKKGANPFGLGKPISAETFQEVLRFPGILASKAAFQLAEFRVTAHFCFRPLPSGVNSRSASATSASATTD
jgi:hypothetical protein